MSDNGDRHNDISTEIARRRQQRDVHVAEFRRLTREIEDLERHLMPESATPEGQRRRWRVIDGGALAAAITIAASLWWMAVQNRERPILLVAAVGATLGVGYLWKRFELPTQGAPVLAAGAVVTAAMVFGTQIAPAPGGTPFADPPRDAEILLPDRTPRPTPSFDRTPSPTLIPSDPAFSPTPTATLPMTGSPSPTSSPTPTEPPPRPTTPPPPSPTPTRTTPPPTPTPTPTRTPPRSPSPTPTRPSPTPTPTPDWLLCVDLPPVLRDLCLLNLDDLLRLLGDPADQ